jgi:hypothetical protein
MIERFKWLRWMRRALWLALVAVPMLCRGSDLTDMFADRNVTDDDSNSVQGNNSQATVEPFEPLHAGKPGGHSMWMAWVASADGLVTFDTTGSTFDTLLAVYVLGPGTNQSPMQLLVPVVANDDNGTLKTSLVQFAATAGTEYEIAVDGYAGAVGDITLEWNLQRSSPSLPDDVSVPRDRSVRPGDTLTLRVGFDSQTPVALQWMFNGQALANAQNATLVVPNFQDVNAGRYQLQFTANSLTFLTQPIEVQINSEGVTNALARDKAQDAPGSELEGEDDGGPDLALVATSNAIGGKQRRRIGVVLGYSGSQIFNTTFATTDPDEPPHCNLPATASYWFGYQPPTNGTALLNTIGSQFPTVLAVYTYTPPLADYSGLTPVMCDTNSGLDGRSSQVEFTADPMLKYLIVVDGATNGARGIAYLNYRLASAADTNLTFPVIALNPQSRSVALGSTVSFGVLARGTNPVSYGWLKDSLLLTDQTNSSLTLTNVQVIDQGGYSAVLTNSFGSATSSVATLSVILPPAISLQPLPQQAYAGSQAVFTAGATGTSPLHYAWNRDGAPLSGTDAATLTLGQVSVTNAGNYSMLCFNSAGTVLSDAAPLSVLGQPLATMNSTSGVMTVQFPAAGPVGFVIESTAQLNPTLWQPWDGRLLTNNGLVSLSSDSHSNGLSFFRVRFP